MVTLFLNFFSDIDTLIGSLGVKNVVYTIYNDISKFKNKFFKKVCKFQKKQTNKRGVTFHSLLVEIHSLLVTRCKITRYSLQNALVTRCRSCSLQKITRYLLQKLLVAKNHSLLVAEVARCKKSLVTRCKIHSLLVAKIHSSLFMKKPPELMFI